MSDRRRAARPAEGPAPTARTVAREDRAARRALGDPQQFRDKHHRPLPRRVRPRAHGPPDSLRGGARARRHAGRHHHRRQAHHQEAVGLVQRGYRARQVAALEIVDYVAIVNEPSAVAAIEALRPDVYVKGPEYANLLLDKTANIFREKALVESYGGRHPFHDRRNVLLDQAVALPAGVARGRAGQSAAAQRSRAVPRSSRAAGSRSRSSRAFWRGASRAARLPARRDDHRRVGGRHGRRTCRRSRAAWPGSRRRASARSAAPASSRCTWPASSRGRTASPTAGRRTTCRRTSR